MAALVLDEETVRADRTRSHAFDAGRCVADQRSSNRARTLPSEGDRLAQHDTRRTPSLRLSSHVSSSLLRGTGLQRCQTNRPPNRIVAWWDWLPSVKQPLDIIRVVPGGFRFFMGLRCLKRGEGFKPPTRRIPPRPLFPLLAGLLADLRHLPRRDHEWSRQRCARFVLSYPRFKHRNLLLLTRCSTPMPRGGLLCGHGPNTCRLRSSLRSSLPRRELGRAGQARPRHRRDPMQASGLLSSHVRPWLGPLKASSLRLSFLADSKRVGALVAFRG